MYILISSLNICDKKQCYICHYHTANLISTWRITVTHAAVAPLVSSYAPVVEIEGTARSNVRGRIGKSIRKTAGQVSEHMMSIAIV